MSDLSKLVTQSLGDEAASEFMDRVESQADQLRDAIDAGEMDNSDFAVGLEIEVYAIDDESAAETVDGENEQPTDRSRLVPLPEAAFESGANKELGLHNAELNTDPDVFDTDGLASQAGSIAEQFERAQAGAQEEGCQLVLDAMWTLPPETGSDDYLSAVEDDDGVTVAANMRTDPRYVAIDNEVLELAGGSIPLDVPGTASGFPTILFESLATSIQPHLQVPTAAAFPDYYNTAIRTLGPVLALSANSPFLPPDMYNAVEDPQDLVEDTHHELRIAVFEQSVNQSPNAKVRVPEDIATAGETVDNVVEDDLFAPFLREWLADDDRESFEEQYWEFDYKRSTYWRWLRCVVGGDPVRGANTERSLRIEYRPIPTQPTITDIVGMQSLTAGLIHGLVVADHPLAELPWEDAKQSFYNAAESGIDGEMTWLTADGERTSNPDIIFGEVFAYAREGLDAAGLPPEDIEEYIAPIEARWDARFTPSMWKKARVREALDEGHSLEEAITTMQEQYIQQSQETSSFAEWL